MGLTRQRKNNLVNYGCILAYYWVMGKHLDFRIEVSARLDTMIELQDYFMKFFGVSSPMIGEWKFFQRMCGFRTCNCNKGKIHYK